MPRVTESRVAIAAIPIEFHSAAGNCASAMIAR
jgi:hypothetical protein